MIKEDKVLVPINLRNRSYFQELGYDIKSDGFIFAFIKDLKSGSKVKVTSVCEICGNEKSIQYSKYLMNKNRNNKGYYSCFDCKNIEKEKTCMKKWGVRSYSMTEDFKVNESKKWKGIQKGSEKGKSTMIIKYGVDSFFKTDIMRERNREWMSSDIFKEKSKKTIKEKWGVDSYSKTDEFKSKINDKKDIILSKIKETFFNKYGVDWYSKTDEFKSKINDKKDEIVNSIKKTCIERYGIDNISKLEETKDKIKKTKIELGMIIPDELLSGWLLYKRHVRRHTNRHKKVLFELWDGYDYYDGEFIKGYLSYSPVHRYYPTVDHKISTYYGFVNNIPVEEISDISNLCMTKRFINSKKKEMIEENFKINL